MPLGIGGHVASGIVLIAHRCPPCAWPDLSPTERIRERARSCSGPPNEGIVVILVIIGHGQIAAVFHDRDLVDVVIIPMEEDVEATEHEHVVAGGPADRHRARTPAADVAPGREGADPGAREIVVVDAVEVFIVAVYVLVNDGEALVARLIRCVVVGRDTDSSKMVIRVAVAEVELAQQLRS